ncbi:MAG: glycosyltransferase family 9 protein, partial [Deltaproteobacteria bacterium]|nr:glycosyltransferase family 9 protein [Deltaproteobacteria bacterium]
PDVCRASFLAYFSGAPWRVGYSEQVNLSKQSANPGWDCLYTHLLHETSVKHEVEVNLDIIRFLGGKVQKDRLEMWFNPEDETFADQLLASHRYPSGAPLIAFGLGAGDSKRIWPLSKFIQLGAWLNKAYGAYILALGGKSDESLGWQLYKYLPDAVANLSGRTTLRQAGALLKRCTLFVGNDSGPMHLAAAAGVPVVEISCHPIHGLTNHPNSPQRFGPWGVPHTVLQPRTSPKSCAQACVAEKPHCILNVPVGAVQDAIRMHLAPQGTR